MKKKLQLIARLSEREREKKFKTTEKVRQNNEIEKQYERKNEGAR